jgi:hypothetical protein
MYCICVLGISVLFTIGEVMYCICVLGISVLFTIGEVMYCLCVLGISVLFTIGEVMYCICVLGDICFIYYRRSHVLYMCVRGYQFYLLLEKSCTVYVC